MAATGAVALPVAAVSGLMMMNGAPLLTGRTTTLWTLAVAIDDTTHQHPADRDDEDAVFPSILTLRCDEDALFRRF